MACDYSHSRDSHADYDRILSPPTKPNILGMEDLWRKPQSQRRDESSYAVDRICPGTKNGANRNSERTCTFVLAAMPPLGLTT